MFSFVYVQGYDVVLVFIKLEIIIITSYLHNTGSLVASGVWDRPENSLITITTDFKKQDEER